MTVLDRRDPKTLVRISELDLPSSAWYVHPIDERKALIVGRGCNWWDDCSDVVIKQIATSEPPRVIRDSSVSVDGIWVKVLEDQHVFLFSNDIAWVLAHDGNEYSAYGVSVAGESIAVRTVLPVSQFTSRAIVVGRMLYLIARTGQIYTHDLGSYANLGDVTLGEQYQ